jgi:chaperonin cofactor prefoldin
MRVCCVVDPSPRTCLQERLELLETENDLLLAQQGELEEEIQRLGALLQDKDMQVRRD